MANPAEVTDPAREAKFEELSQKAVGSNVNDKTLLATDYMNHINEIVMLMELVPDAPECLEDCKAWQPVSYQDHFRNSSIHDKDLAIEAYDWAPLEYREPFDRLVTQMNRLIALSVQRLERLHGEENFDMARLVAERASRNLQDLIGQASAVIHGDGHVIDQEQIDALLEVG